MNVTTQDDLDYFLDMLYGEHVPAHIEVCSIEGDPDDREHCTFHQSWFTYAPWHKDDLIARIRTLSTKYGNVYVSLTSYSRRTRDKRYALDGDVIVLDDAASGDYSFTVQTSPTSMHAYRKLSTLADVATREDLARRETYATGADKSGWDITQLVRVPETFNTKGKYAASREKGESKGYPVTLHHGSGRTFTPDELCKRFPAAPAHMSIGEVSANWEPAQRWIANAELLISNGIPRRFTNPNAQGRKVLEGNYVPMSASGHPDTSEMRYVGIKSLVFHGYPDDEARAVAWLLFGYESEQYHGSDWLRQDIDRCIAKARAECAKQGRHIDIRATTGIFVRPSTPAPTVQGSRARKDRPQRVTEAAYLAWCHEHMDARNEVAYTRREAAAALGLKQLTLDRIERRLRERGAIERFTSPDRRRSWLAIYAKPMMIAPNADAVEAVADVAEIEENRSPSVLSHGLAHIEHAHVGEEHTAPIAAAPTPSVDVSGAAVDADTGEVEPSKLVRVSVAVRSTLEECDLQAIRPTVQRVWYLLNIYYPGHTWTPTAVAYHYRVALAERRWKRMIDDLTTMKQAKLTRLERCCERILAEGRSGPQAKRLGWARMMQPHILAEQERREPMKQRTKVHGNRGKPPRPTQLGLADAMTPAAVDVPTGGSLSAACVPPLSTVVVPLAPRPTMHEALQTYYQCFDVGNFGKASAVVAPYPQLADLYDQAQAAQQVRV